MDSINLTSCLENRFIKNEDLDITYTEDFEDDDTNFTFYYSSPYLILEEDGVSYQEQFKITVDTKELIMYLDEIRTLNTLESGEDDEDELDDILIKRLVKIPYQVGIEKIKNNIDLRTNNILKINDTKTLRLENLYSEINQLLFDSE